MINQMLQPLKDILSMSLNFSNIFFIFWKNCRGSARGPRGFRAERIRAVARPREPLWACTQRTSVGNRQKQNVFYNTSNNVYLPKRISRTHLEYLKKDLRNKKNTQILGIEISSLFAVSLFWHSMILSYFFLFSYVKE